MNPTARGLGWLLLTAGVAIGCGETPARVGVLLNAVGLQKTDAGRSPTDLPSRGYLPSSYVRVKHADVAGDSDEETLVELELGKGIKIEDSRGGRLGDLPTDEYLTDFGAVPASRPGKKDVVIYTYPNRDRGGTFRVVTPDRTEIARWVETIPPARFDAGIWKGQAALFYLVGNSLVVRSPRGDMLSTLSAPDGAVFQQVHIGNTRQDRTVLVASGSGYTPYHMVCVYEADGRLVFQEVGREHAFDLEVARDRFEFTVWTRSTGWRYRVLASDSRF